MEKYPRRRNPRTIISVAIIVTSILVASLAIYNFYQTEPLTIKVYTYDSFLKWGPDYESIDELAFGPFEDRYNIEIEIVRLLTDASGIITRLSAESSNPIADVVIGIDNILILKENTKDVLETYSPSNLNQIDSTLIDLLDPEHYISPIDYGLVSLIYSQSSINTTSNPDIANMTLSTLADYSDALVTENPHLSSPGLAFLLTEIAMSEKLLNQDWKDWWIDVNANVSVVSGWTEAWNVWYESPTRHFLNSYGTDPAYSAYFYGSPPDTAVAPLHHNGTDYAWMQVEGIGLVKDGPNPDIAKLFIDYCLSEEFQDFIGINQWMFPANPSVEMDPAFQYALQLEDVSLLNDLLARSEIESNLDLWLEQWDIIRTGY
jgi:thiamine transport system substrate-binding protein